MLRFSAPARMGLLLLAVLLLFVSMPRRARAEEPESAKGKTLLSTAPDFTARGLDGKTYRLADLLKKGPVLVDFWTTWCKPCMRELPELEKLYLKYKDQGFTLIAIPSDDVRSAAKIEPIVRSKGFKFPNVPDTDRKIGNQYNVRNYPTSFLVSPDGRIAAFAQGYMPGDEVKLEEKIVALLGSPSQGKTDEGEKESDASGDDPKAEEETGGEPR